MSQVFVFSSPIFLGLALGFLISKGDWHFALGLAALAPLAVLFSARPFIGVILWLLLMPLSSALPNPELMYWVIHRILIPFTLCMALLPHLANSSRLPHFRLGLPELSIALLAGYVPVSILLGQTDMRLSLIKYADRMLIPFCVYLVVRLISLDERDLGVLQWTAFAVAVIQCMIGFLSWVAPQLLPRAWHHLMGVRTAGSLLDPAVFTSMLVFCAVLLFNAAMQRKDGPVRLMFLLACGASFICVFISLERGSWLAGSLVLLGLLVLYPRTMLRFLLVCAVGMIILGGGFLSRQVTLATQRIGDQRPIDDRIVVTDAMLQMIQDKAVLGWGYDTLNKNIWNFYRQVGSASIIIGFTTSHNTYLTIFTELGLVGLLLYLLPVIWLLTASLRAWRGPPGMGQTRRLLISTLWLAALHNFVVSNFMDMRFSPIGLTLWWMNLGLIADLVYQHAEARDRFFSNRAAQARRQVQSFDELLLENNGTRRK